MSCQVTAWPAGEHDQALEGSLALSYVSPAGSVVVTVAGAVVAAPPWLCFDRPGGASHLRAALALPYFLIASDHSCAWRSGER